MICGYLAIASLAMLFGPSGGKVNLGFGALAEAAGVGAAGDAGGAADLPASPGAAAFADEPVFDAGVLDTGKCAGDLGLTPSLLDRSPFITAAWSLGCWMP